MIMRFKNKVITVLIIIAMLLVLVTVFLFCFYHITWKREIVGYALPPKDIETAKEKYGGTGDTPENAIDLPAREMTTIQVVKFPWDSNESYENKDKITQETLAIAIRYYYDFDNGAGPEFDMKYRFLFGTPHTITYKLYGEPGGTEYIVSVRLNKSSYRVDYHIVYN